jgi:hypothetical protein
MKDSIRETPVARGPGKTSMAPTMIAAQGSPPRIDVEHRHRQQNHTFRGNGQRVRQRFGAVCNGVDRWPYGTPFGLPVVPDVLRIDDARRWSNVRHSQRSFCAASRFS